MDLEEIEGYKELRKLISKLNWKKFEEITGKIFELNNYETEVSKVVTFEETKRQYDVIAECSDYFIIADCKKWDKKRRKKSGLKKAAEEQVERAEKLKYSKQIYPLVILSCNTSIRLYKKVPIVPVQKLNNFLLNFEANKERILKV